MKKYISLMLAIIMAAALLPGCTPADVELWAAIKRTGEAENFTVTERMSWSVDVHEPIRTEILIDDGYYTPEETAESDERSNSIIDILTLLAQDMTLDSTLIKDGSNYKADLKFSKPDLRLFFTFWQQMENNTAVRQIFKIPSLFISPATRGKEYMVLDTASQAGTVPDAYTQALGEYTEDLNELVEFIMSRLSSLAGEAEITGSANVYTVHVDAAALRKMTDEIIDAITTDEGASLMIDAYMDIVEMILEQAAESSGESIEELRAEAELPTAEEARAAYDEAMKNARLYAAAIGEQVEKSGLLKNGFTARYTVNSAGLIEKVETEMIFDIDVEAVNAAFIEILAIMEGTGADTFTDPYISTKGSFTVAFKNTADYDYTPVEVTMPEVTGQNSVDLYAEQAEYQKYRDEKNEWRNKWSSYISPYIYERENPDNAPIAIHNLANGRELTSEPLTASYSVYIPVADFAELIGASCAEWDSELMGVAIDDVAYRSGPATLVILNDNGNDLYYDFLYGTEYNTTEYTGDTLTPYQVWAYAQIYEGVDYRSTSAYALFTEEGKCYVDMDYLRTLGYKINIDGTNINIDLEENIQFEYDESIKNNFFYKLFESLYLYW